MAADDDVGARVDQGGGQGACPAVGHGGAPRPSGGRPRPRRRRGRRPGRRASRWSLAAARVRPPGPGVSGPADHTVLAPSPRRRVRGEDGEVDALDGHVATA